ncbi:MAG TPA: hypothetical protein PKI19_00570 [Elusimicrobiales bacterium]|nr:hypothetical protein [Elusimicrobiales bacterium]
MKKTGLILAAVLAVAAAGAGAEEGGINFDGRALKSSGFFTAAGWSGSTPLPAPVCSAPKEYKEAAAEAPAVPAAKAARRGIRQAGYTFKSNNIDENGYGWAMCSDTSQRWNMEEVEYRTVKTQRQERYVCKFNVSWSCSWRNCKEIYPHTQPGECYCKAACSQSARNTNECYWEPVD